MKAFRFSTQPGAIKEKLAKLISCSIPGIEVYPEDLRRNFGSNKYTDTCHWEACVKVNGREAILMGFSTMSSIVRHGVDFNVDRGIYEIYAKGE